MDNVALRPDVDVELTAPLHRERRCDTEVGIEGGADAVVYPDPSTSSPLPPSPPEPVSVSVRGQGRGVSLPTARPPGMWGGSASTIVQPRD